MNFISNIVHGTSSQSHTHADGTTHSHSSQANYFTAEEKLFTNLFFFGLALSIVSAILFFTTEILWLPIVLLTIGIVMMIPRTALVVMIWRIAPERFKIVEKIQSQIPWRGDEQVLDVGTGSGILLVGCGQKLTTGHGIGIDIWLPDAGGGTPELFQHNIKVEGLADKLELQNVDVREMPFEDGSFDVIVSSLAMHHVGAGSAERLRGIREMIRTLKPGGYIALYDLSGVLKDGIRLLEDQGFSTINRQGRMFQYILVQKPA